MSILELRDVHRVHGLPENEAGQRPYRVTDAGRAELAAWFATPIERGDRPRDELAIKLALALTTPGVDVGAVVQAQRGATMRTLQEYTRLKARAARPADLAVLHGCAGCRWLFLDRSRGRGRRWCSMADCGTEAKKRRYVQRRRERRAAGGAGHPGPAG